MSNPPAHSPEGFHPPPAPCAVVHDNARGVWLALTAPLRIFATDQMEEVAQILAELDSAVQSGEGTAAGWVSYEAATAFDANLKVKPAGAVPLMWFALFAEAREVTLPPAPDEPIARDWQPDVSPAQYQQSVRRILDYIREGDTYQVNFTYRQQAGFAGDAWRAFLRLVTAQRDTYGAYIDTGRFVVCSASPELYFRMDGEQVMSKPMKGTAARGLTLLEDREQARNLRASEKERAENLMIVDMVRNDFGRLADVGSVRVPHLFEVEKYPTLWTMTSTVEARIPAGLPRIFAETFPPASITGAPKRRTMDIIAELEPGPRGVYTGAVGWMAPERVAQFNVGIRTLVVDRERGIAEYGVGSGIVSDGIPEREWAECATKTRILRASIKPLSLLETLKWTPEEGYVLLERHLARLLDSAEYFDIAVGSVALRHALEVAARNFSTPMRVRLLVDERAQIRVESRALDTAPQLLMRLRLAAAPIDSHNRFLYHKTTQRDVYERARESLGDADDVVLWNERGEVCETTIANLAILQDSLWITPPVASGLLPGTLRAELLAREELVERVISVEMMWQAKRVRLFNSVRGVFEGELIA